MEKNNKTKSSLKQASYESQAITEKVRWMSLPKDVRFWIHEAINFANKLPDDLEQKNFILRFASFALSSIGNEQKLKEYLYQIQNNIDNAKHDISLMKQESGAKKGGSRSKHKVWADIVAEWLLEDFPNLTEKEIWEKIPDSIQPKELEDEYDDFMVYKDGDDLIKTQQGIDKKLKKSTFFKNYYRKIKSSRK